LYADADGDGGIDALDALGTLASGVWPATIQRKGGVEPFPCRGAGRIWSDASGTSDWARLLPLPYTERFLRLPCSLLVGAGMEVMLRVWVGPGIAGTIARSLRGRLFVNHLLLGNRVVERVEPDASDGAGDEEVELAGHCPVLLELQDVETGHQYFD